ncbi:radical SAM protein [Lachnospiraceae bacterium 46-15]
MEELYWVGIKESEIRSCINLFKGSVTFVGSGKNGNISYSARYRKVLNYNKDSDELDDFIKETLLSLISKNQNVKFMFYNPYFAFYLGGEILKHAIIINKIYSYNLLRDKMKTRLWLSNAVPTLKSIALSYSQCSLEYFKKIFPGYMSFVLQGCTGAGGNDTYVVDDKSWQMVKKYLNAHEIFLLSPYIKSSFSINVHVIIGNNIIITPGSVQIVEKVENRLIFHGSDFVEYSNLSEEIKEKIQLYSGSIAKLIKNLDYKGILGIDFLVFNNEVYFLEINPRFQSSTPLLNEVLSKKYGITLQDIYLEIYMDSEYTVPQFQYDVPFSVYITDAHRSYGYYHTYLKNAAESKEVVAVFKDGFEEDIVYEDYASIYSVLLETNITTVNPNGTLNIHENIKVYQKEFPRIDSFYCCLDLKTKLLSQGAKISKEAEKIMRQEGIRKGTYSSIDIYIQSNFIINTPIGLKLCSMSPFEIHFKNNRFWLLYAGETVCLIHLDKNESFCNLKTKAGKKYEDLSFLATDRLRLHHSLGCFFKRNKCGCDFCDVPSGSPDYNKNEITEIIDWHIANSKFRHILIGGGSEQRKIEYVRIIEIIRYLRSKTDKPIYLMALPPKNLQILSAYYHAGLDEIAFNIEVFDNNLRKKYMPGKGSISLKSYQEALLKAVELWGKKGNVKSSILYGLESDASFLLGIEWLASHGIQPIISTFRPLQNTEMKNRIVPESSTLKKIFYTASNICQTYHLSPGPDCIYCQNNTLSLSNDIFSLIHN